MARGKGHQSIVAFRAGGATWGTAVACGAGHGFYARKFNLSGGPGNIPDEQITGAYVQKIATPGAIDGKAMIECDLTGSRHRELLRLGHFRGDRHFGLLPRLQVRGS